MKMTKVYVIKLVLCLVVAVVLASSLVSASGFNTFASEKQESAANTTQYSDEQKTAEQITTGQATTGQTTTEQTTAGQTTAGQTTTGQTTAEQTTTGQTTAEQTTTGQTTAEQTTTEQKTTEQDTAGQKATQAGNVQTAALSDQAGSHSHEGVNFETELTKANLDTYLKTDDGGKSYYLEGGSYYLGEDLNLTKTICIYGIDGKAVNICLNGHVINGAGIIDETGVKAAFYIKNHGSAEKSTKGILNIYDCNTTTVHNFGDDSGKWTWDDSLTKESVKHTVTGGCITGTDGFGILLEQGSLGMHGGTIAGNKCGLYDQEKNTLSLSGDTSVTGNGEGNLILNAVDTSNTVTFEKITVDNDFTGNAGITLKDSSSETPSDIHYGIFTTANTKDLHDKFSSDLEGYNIIFNDSSCLEVVQPAEITIKNQNGTVLQTISENGNYTGYRTVLPSELKEGYDFTEYVYGDSPENLTSIAKGTEFTIPAKETTLYASLFITFTQQPSAENPTVATAAEGVSYQWYEIETASIPVEFTGSEIEATYYAQNSTELTDEAVIHLTFPNGIPSGLNFDAGSATSTGENTFDVIPVASDAGVYTISISASEPVTVTGTKDIVNHKILPEETSPTLSTPESYKTYFCRVTDSEGIYADTNAFNESHVHAWTYELSNYNKTVTATCKGTDTCDYTGTDKSLTLQAPSVLSYDGTEKAASFGEATSFLGGSLPTISYEYKATSEGTYSAAASTKLAGFYKASFTVGEGTEAKTAYIEYTIEKTNLTVTGATVYAKTYDGTTDAQVNTTTAVLNGVASGDDVNIATAAGTFAAKNAGSAINVTIKYTLGGADASNYTVSDSTANADINKRQVILTSATASKTYDGSALTDINITATGDGWADSEGAVFKVTGSQTKVGTIKNSFAYVLLSNTDKDNYTITTVDGTLTVTAKQLAISSETGKTTTVSDKEYDGTTDAKATIGTVTGIVDGDDVTVEIYSVAFTNKDVGQKKTVDVVYKMSGTDAENYNKPVAAKLNANITAKPVTVKAIDKTMTIGKTVPTFTAEITGLLGTDNVEYSFNTISPSTQGVYTIMPSGETSQGNYSVTFTSGVLTVNGLDSGAKVSATDLEKIRNNYSSKEEYADKVIDVVIKTDGNVSDTDKSLITAKTGTKKVTYINTGLYLISSSSGQSTEKDIGDENDTLVSITYKFSFTNKKNLQVLKVHNGTVSVLTSTANADGEYMKYNTTAGTITVTAKKYSAFAFAYTDTSTNSTGSTGKSVATGDSNNSGLYVIIALLALAVLAAAAVIRRKAEK